MELSKERKELLRLLLFFVVLPLGLYFLFGLMGSSIRLSMLGDASSSVLEFFNQIHISWFDSWLSGTIFDPLIENSLIVTVSFIGLALIVVVIIINKRKTIRTKMDTRWTK